MRRPDNFFIKTDHPLAMGLMFAGLSSLDSESIYFDSSPYRNNAHPLDSQRTYLDFSYLHNRRGFSINASATTYALYLTRALSFPVLTIAMWLRTKDNGTYRCLLGSASNRFNGVDNYRWSYNSGAIGDAVTRWDGHVGVLHHTIFTIDSPNSNIHHWRDKSYRGFGTNAAFSTAPNFNMIFGDNSWRSNFYCDIADLLIYNRFLNSAEINQLGDPSNIMLDGFIQYPKRKLFSYYNIPTITTTAKKRRVAISSKLGYIITSGYF
jgi:hypothetical protein